MAKTQLGNVSRNDVVCFKDELDSNAPVDLSDINATGAGASKILAIDSGGTALEWITQTGSATALSALSDCTITTPNDAALLIYDTGTARWRDADMSGDGTISDTGVFTLANNIIGYQSLNEAATELGTRLCLCSPSAANGSEVANEIEMSYGFLTPYGNVIDYTDAAWLGQGPPCARFIVSSSVNGPKRHTSAYISSVTQGTAVDGLNTAECLIKGTEPQTGTHIKFKVKYTGVGNVYVFVGTPDAGYFMIMQGSLIAAVATFA